MNNHSLDYLFISIFLSTAILGSNWFFAEKQQRLKPVPFFNMAEKAAIYAKQLILQHCKEKIKKKVTVDKTVDPLGTVRNLVFGFFQYAIIHRKSWKSYKS
jgi:hypothetical protein